MAKNKALEKLLAETKKQKVGKRIKQRPIIESILFQAMIEVATEARCNTLIEQFQAAYMDWNEVRISRAYHIMDAIDATEKDLTPVKVALATLARVFHELGDLTDNLFSAKPDGEVRKKLESMLSKPRDAAALVMMEALGRTTIPVTEGAIEYLKEKKVVDENLKKRQIQRFLTDNLDVKEHYAFYLGLEKILEKKNKTKKKEPKTTKKEAK